MFQVGLLGVGIWDFRACGLALDRVSGFKPKALQNLKA